MLGCAGRRWGRWRRRRRGGGSDDRGGEADGAGDGRSHAADVDDPHMDAGAAAVRVSGVREPVLRLPLVAAHHLRHRRPSGVSVPGPLHGCHFA